MSGGLCVDGVTESLEIGKRKRVWARLTRRGRDSLVFEGVVAVRLGPAWTWRTRFVWTGGSLGDADGHAIFGISVTYLSFVLQNCQVTCQLIVEVGIGVIIIVSFMLLPGVISGIGESLHDANSMAKSKYFAAARPNNIQYTSDREPTGRFHLGVRPNHRRTPSR